MHKIFFTFFIAIFAISPISAEEKQKIPTFGDWAKKCETAKIREQNKEGVTDKKICYVFNNKTLRVTLFFLRILILQVILCVPMLNQFVL